MMKKTPQFSIVIPTRNRANLLRHSLKTALAQTFEDYEVVVSDNDSSDETPKLVESLRCERLRYVRTPRSLCMADSWQYGLDHAAGDYIMMLGDDDAVSPVLLERLSQIIKQYQNPHAIAWSCVGYYHENWYDVADRNTLLLPRQSEGVQSVPSAGALHGIFDELWPSDTVPKMLNSISSRALVERVRQKAGRLFIPSCSDISSAVFTLALVPEFIWIDEPVMISGSARESTGAGQWHQKRALLKKFYDEFDGETLFQRMQLKGLVGINFIVQTLVDAKHLMPEELASCQINWARYYAHYFEGLDFFGRAGVDVAAESAELERVFRQESSQVRDATQKLLDANKTPLMRRMVRKMIQSSAALQKLELRLRPNLQQSKPIIVRGSDFGFCDIVECAAKLPAILRAAKQGEI